MGYDLAMWVGEPPESDAEGTMQLEERFDHYQFCGHPAAPEIRDFIDRALTVFPVDTPEELDASPWRDILLQDSARGDMIYFTLLPSTPPGTIRELIALGRECGLVVVDPQTRCTH